jgi:hypothetical protein
MKHLIGLSLVMAGAAGALQQPPIRQLPAIAAKSAVSWSNIAGVRALSGGRVLVNDVFGRKVVLLDSALSTITVVADTTPATATAYSGRMASLIAYRGDSTLFVDPQSISMTVIDPNGKLTRVMALPRSEDAMMLGGAFGTPPAFDGNGRLVYRGAFRFTRTAAAHSMGSGLPPMPVMPESTAVVRVDLASRQVDTVGKIRIPKVNMQVSQDDKGNMRMVSEVNPLPVVDDWAVLPDGAVAFVRGQDYHVDFVNGDGSKLSAPKIPFDWQRLSDEDKVAFIDSVKAARARLAASAPSGAGAPNGGAAPAQEGGQRVVIQMGPDGGRGGGRAPSTFNAQPEVSFIAPSELPDYKPPFLSGSIRADTEGNLWIRTIPTRQIAGGPVYDVVNREGKLVDRVQVPTGRVIAGFGPRGAVYLTSRDGQTMTLERANVR